MGAWSEVRDWRAGCVALVVAAAVWASLGGAPAAAGAGEENRDRLTVIGRVHDADGKPVGGAAVAVLGRPKPRTRLVQLVSHVRVLGQGKAAADGTYRLTLAPLSKERYYDACVVAHAAGHGLAQHPFDPDARRLDVSLRLAREQVLRGRLLNLEGQPVSRARVGALRAVGKQPSRDRFAVEFQDAPTDLLAWIEPAVSDGQGRFALRGLGPDWSVTLAVADDRFARQTLVVNPDPLERASLQQLQRAGGSQALVEARPRKDRPEDFSWSLMPARVFEGTVTHADTHRPVAGARIVSYVGQQYFSLMSQDRADTRTDRQGRYRLIPRLGRMHLFFAYPPDGEPYLLQSKTLQLNKADVVKHTLDFTLSRGVEVVGRVVERPSGKPVALASIEYVPRSVNNPFFRREVIAPFAGLKQVAASGPDGTFRLPVLPGPGHLLINGPTGDYLHAETSRRHLDAGEAGGIRYYPNAYVQLALKPDTRLPPLTITLRRGVTVRCRLVGPDDKPVATALVWSRFQIPYGYTHEQVGPMRVKDGTMELAGCDPEKSQPVFIVNGEKQLGALLQLSGKEAKDRPLTVRLQPCGSAVARFVDEKGQPIAGFRPSLELLITPGITQFESFREKGLVADAASMLNVDRNRYRNLRPDANGRFTFPTLIPGATYRLLGRPTMQGYDLERTFTVEAGKTLDLKDVPIKAPK
jgi:hypothetical protein